MNKAVMMAITSIMVILVASFGIGLMAQDSYAQLPEYEVKVTFDSITIHNDHEGVASGDGEFDLSAFVQGKRVDLTKATGEKLWDAQEGKTYQFNPGTEVTVLVPENVQLSFIVGGGEDDGEGKYWYPAREKYFKELLDRLQDPNVLLDKAKVDEVKLLISANLQVHSFCSFPTLNCNDNIGDIQLYNDAPDYGNGSHEEKANRNDYTLRYTISASPMIESTCNNNLPVSSANSSGYLPTFLPSNAIDNNPNTIWWSTIIVNPFITLDLGTSNSVCEVDIAWADGNSHPYKFDVSVSTDGTSFTNVLSATSTGTTTSPEKYNFPPTQARYVKITITESTAGAQRSIAEISEIDVFG